MRYFSLALILLCSVFLISSKKVKQPNVIIVYFDDMGYGDIALTGAVGYKTPNFDALARDGLFFSQFYSPQAVCTASRAGLLTGCYPNRIGFAGAIDHMAKVGLNPEEETIAELLKEKKYATAAYGKWHLGFQEKFLPTNHGFDEFYGIPYSNDMWPNHPVTKNYYPDLPLYRNTEIVELDPDQSRFTTEFTEHTVNFIKKNKRKPFFVYLAHPMPHVPLAVSEKFKGKSEQGLYGDVMMELDWSIGEIRNALKKYKLEENTLLIVTSDNGPWLNYGNHAGSTGGLRGGKGNTWEGGQKVPCLMVWKNTIPAGRVVDNLAAGIDILPTIVEATGAKFPKFKIDGVSLLSVLKGDFSQNPRSSFAYYYRKNNLEAVRNDRWKLVFEHKGRNYEDFLPGDDGMPGHAEEFHLYSGGLFDIRRDPGERYDVSEKYPEVKKMLEEEAQKYREDLGDDLQNIQGKNRREIGRVD